MNASASPADCIFCRIVRKEVPATILFEDEDAIAFHDLAPKAPTHLLVVPRKHIDRLATAEDGDTPLIGRLMKTIVRVAAERDLPDFRVVVNNGAGAGQSVFHLHFHLLAGAFTWPPG
ncbi:MAG: histidine triad nucleotide-binding protein [Thermoanaerobaculia bacterium]